MKKKIIVKEPGGIVGAPDILLQLLPKSKMIALIRDGRDVIDSVCDARTKSGFMAKFGDTPITQKNKKTSIEFLSKVWNEYMKNLIRTFENYPKNLRYMIKYEDLLNDTSGELKKLYGFIGVKVSDDEINKIVEKFSFKNILSSEKGPGKFTRSATPGKWKESFSKEEQKTIDNIIGNTLRKFGYEV